MLKTIYNCCGAKLVWRKRVRAAESAGGQWRCAQKPSNGQRLCRSEISGAKHRVIFAALGRNVGYTVATGAGVLLLWWWAGMGAVLRLPPQGYHVWAQADRAAVARIYHQEGIRPLHPKTYYLGSPSGEVGMEFPAMAIGAAVLYDFFGFNEFWYRLLMLVIVFGGLMGFYGIARRWAGNLNSALLTILWSLSPVVLFYGPNFLPDAAAMGLVLMCWAFFLQQREKQSRGKVLAMLMMACMALLLKPTSLAFLAPMVLLAGPRNWRIWALSAIPAAVAGAWFLWAQHLNAENGSVVFSLGAHPAGSAGEIGRALVNWGVLVISRYASLWVWLGLGMMIVIRILRRENARRDLLRIIGYQFIGLGAVLIFFLGTVSIHDYYGIMLLVPFMLGSIAAISTGKKGLWISAIILLLLISVAALHGRQELSNAAFDWSEGTFPQLKTIREMNHREPNLPAEARVVTLTDHSMNTSLYYFNRRGWTVWPQDVKNNLDSFVRLGATHAAITDTNLLHRNLFRNQLGPLQESLAGIRFYELRVQ